MQGRIAFTALDICAESGDSGYQKFPPLKQINTVVTRIRAICTKLAETEPDSMWIIGLPEHPFFSALIVNERGNFYPMPIAHPDKEHMHAQMTKLVKEFPQLTIIAGGITVERKLVSTEKKSSLAKKLAHIESFYEHHHKKILKQEQKELKKEEQFSSAFARVKDASEKAKKLKENIKSKEELELERLSLISTTAYIYTADEKKGEQKEVSAKIIKHRKSAPHSETPKETQLFRPASTRTHDLVYRLRHPVTHEDVTLGLEICREHAVGLLSSSNKKRPLIHFVSSDWIDLNPDHLYGSYVIQCDTITPARLIVTDKTLLDHSQLHLYENDVMQDEKIRGPLKPFYPLDLEIRAFFNKYLGEYDAVLAALNQISADFKNDEAKKSPQTWTKLQTSLHQMPKTNELFSWLHTRLEESEHEKKPDHKKLLTQKIETLKKEQAKLREIFANVIDAHKMQDIILYLQDELGKIVNPSFLGKLFFDRDQHAKKFLVPITSKFWADIKEYLRTPGKQFLTSRDKAPVMEAERTRDLVMRFKAD